MSFSLKKHIKQEPYKVAAYKKQPTEVVYEMKWNGLKAPTAMLRNKYRNQKWYSKAKLTQAYSQKHVVTK